MKKALIVTLSTGGGHNYAAASLEEKLHEAGFATFKSDPFKEQDKVLDVLISDGYRTLAKTSPMLYGQMYKAADKNRVNEAVIRIIQKKSEKGILAIIDEHDPDIIISTHPILTFILGALKEEDRLQIPLMAVVTDFEGHHTYTAKHRYVDAYITGSLHTKADLIARGVPSHKIFAYGIPIRQEFYLPRPEKDENEPFTILLMGGSMGVKLMERVLESLVAMPAFLRIVAVCGHDESLYKRLMQAYGKGADNKEILIYGFYQDIAGLMDQSDLMISKPGGLSVSEAIAKRMPLIIPYLIPGQEEDNADFLDGEGAAIKVEDIGNIPSIISMMMEVPHFLKAMQENLANIAKTHSFDAIVDKARELADKDKVNVDSRLSALIFYNGFLRSNADGAMALEHQLLSHHIQAVSMDLFQHVAPALHRSLYRSIAHMAERIDVPEYLLSVPRFRSELVEDVFVRIFFPLFRRIMRRYEPKIIFSFYPELAILSARYKKHYGEDYHLVLTVSEMPHNASWLVRGVDAYMAADPVIKERLLALGAEESRVHLASLPLEVAQEDVPRQSFLKESMPTLVFFGDYLEKWEKPKRFYEWLNESGWQTIVVSGGRKKIRKDLAKGYANIHEIKEVRTIQEVLSHADLLVTKPLYITAYEALRNKVPLVVYSTQKQPLLDIVRRTAMVASNMDELKSILKTFLGSEEMQTEFKQKIEKTLEALSMDQAYVQVAQLLIDGK